MLVAPFTRLWALMIFRPFPLAVRLLGYGSCGLGDENDGAILGILLRDGDVDVDFEDRRPGTLFGRRWVRSLRIYTLSWVL